MGASRMPFASASQLKRTRPTLLVRKHGARQPTTTAASGLIAATGARPRPVQAQERQRRWPARPRGGPPQTSR